MSRDPGRAWDRLSRRERDVAHLAVRGRTTPEIAAELRRSPKTIENHLNSVYRKLGVSNRVDLANLVAGSGAGGGRTGPDPDQIRRAIARNARALEALRELERRLAGVGSDGFMWELAIGLTEVLGVRFAGVSEVFPGAEELCVTVMAERGRRMRQLRLPLENCPCSVTLSEGRLVCYSGLRDRFGHCGPIVELGVDADVAVRLDDRVLGPVGTLWVMDTKPIDPETMPLEVLELFAPRTASELAMHRLIDEVHERRDGGD